MFRDIFAAHPVLSEAVAVPCMCQTLLPCLLAWLRRQSGSVKMLASHGHFLDVALTSLVDPTPPLTMLITMGASPKAMAVLPIFTSLQLCDLTNPDTDAGLPLDLLPLQALPCLQQLKLQQGEFCNLHATAYLTSLSIVDSVVECQENCTFVSTLQTLFKPD